MEVPEKTTVKFKVGRLMKKRIQKEEGDEEPQTAESSAGASQDPPAPGV